MKTASRVLVGIAAASLSLAPMAVQAGTRAASSPVAVDVERGASPLADHSELHRSLLWVLLFLAAVAAIDTATGGRSRG